MCHPCIYGVHFASHSIMSQYSIHLCIPFILCYLFWPQVILHPFPFRVELVASRSTMHFMLYQGKWYICALVPFFPLSIMSVHQLNITIFPPTLVEDPHCLTYRGLDSIDINSFIPKEQTRGWCILVPTYITIQCLRSSIGTHYFPLTRFFHVHDPYI